MFILSIRKFSSSMKIIAYAHATVNTMELFYLMSGLEKKFALPDCIAVNRTRAKNIPINSGFYADWIPIFRSWESESSKNNKPNNIKGLNKQIFIVLSAYINRSIELIIKPSRSLQIRLAFPFS